ncbi:MAG: rRNA maturation RNase YbeY [Thermotogaceae bacterium]|nr:rRNA maturation RNase YbeY [Thermotogaceae bacterium]
MEITNRTRYEIKHDFVEKVVKHVLERENNSGEVSIAFVDAKEITALNEKYRKKDGPTDVLTFPYKDEDMLGEIIICPEIVEKNAKDFGFEFIEELLLTLIHSSLHLCGYDHEYSQENAKEMFEKQEKYFNELREMLL